MFLFHVFLFYLKSYKQYKIWIYNSIILIDLQFLVCNLKLS